MENLKTNPVKHEIHKVLAHSYALHLILFLVGVALDLIFKIQAFRNDALAGTGFILLVLGTLLVFWAQYTSRHLGMENITKETFCDGPYRYTRTPTNFGLFFLVLGFGMTINAFYVMLSAVVSFIIAKIVFLKKEEELLATKYGAPYLEYKKSVKF